MTTDLGDVNMRINVKGNKILKKAIALMCAAAVLSGITGCGKADPELVINSTEEVTEIMTETETTIRTDTSTKTEADSENKEVKEESEGEITLSTEIAPVFGNRKAIVTIVSDDGHFDSGIYLDQLLEKHNLTATVAGAVVIVSQAENEWQDTLSHNRIKMVSHGRWHQPMEEGSAISGDEEALRNEISDAGSYFEDFLGEKPICFVCPENKMCEKGYKILEEDGYVAVRRGDRGLNSLSPEEGTEPGQWFNLRTRGILDEETTEGRNAWVDEAINENGWLIEMWHNVKPEDDNMYQTILIPDADQHLAYLEKKSGSGDIWVTDFETATLYIYEKEHVTIDAVYKDGTITINTGMNEGKLTDERLDVPLTVNLTLTDDIPGDTEFYDAAGEKLSFENGILSFSMIPNRKITEITAK